MAAFLIFDEQGRDVTERVARQGGLPVPFNAGYVLGVAYCTLDRAERDAFRVTEDYGGTLSVVQRTPDGNVPCVRIDDGVGEMTEYGRRWAAEHQADERMHYEAHLSGEPRYTQIVMDCNPTERR